MKSFSSTIGFHLRHPVVMVGLVEQTDTLHVAQSIKYSPQSVHTEHHCAKSVAEIQFRA
jgi:hypothetical protein